MKDNKKFTKKAQILSLNECLYLELEGSFASEEELFSKACEKLDIEKRFEYAFSFMKSEAKTHIFLSEFAKLDTSQKISLCDVILYRNLSKIKKELTSFCVFVLDEKSSYFAFFDKEKLLFIKPIPRALKVLNDENLRLLNLKEYLEQFNCQHCFASTDQDLSPTFNASFLKLDQSLKDELLELELKRKDKSVDFLRDLHGKGLNFNQILLSCFVLSFLICFFLKSVLLYDELKENTKLENQKNEHYSLNLIKEKLSLNDEKIASQNTLLKELKPFHKDRKFLQKLQILFELFHENNTQMLSFDFEQEQFKISVKSLNDRLLNDLYNNDFFILEEKQVDQEKTILFLKAR